MAVDAWCPVMIPALFLSLIGPVKGWDFGLGMDEGESVTVCMIVLWGIFAGRAVYNFGYKKEQWMEIGMGGRRGGKIKTA